LAKTFHGCFSVLFWLKYNCFISVLVLFQLCVRYTLVKLLYYKSQLQHGLQWIMRV